MSSTQQSKELKKPPTSLLARIPRKTDRIKNTGPQQQSDTDPQQKTEKRAEQLRLANKKLYDRKKNNPEFKQKRSERERKNSKKRKKKEKKVDEESSTIQERSTIQETIPKQHRSVVRFASSTDVSNVENGTDGGTTFGGAASVMATNDHEIHGSLDIKDSRKGDSIEGTSSPSSETSPYVGMEITTTASPLLELSTNVAMNVSTVTNPTIEAATNFGVKVRTATSPSLETNTKVGVGTTAAKSPLTRPKASPLKDGMDQNYPTKNGGFLTNFFGRRRMSTAAADALSEVNESSSNDNDNTISELGASMVDSLSLWSASEDILMPEAESRITANGDENDNFTLQTKDDGEFTARFMNGAKNPYKRSDVTIIGNIGLVDHVGVRMIERGISLRDIKAAIALGKTSQGRYGRTIKIYNG